MANPDIITNNKLFLKRITLSPDEIPPFLAIWNWLDSLEAAAAAQKTPDPIEKAPAE